jgi:hypothetical protein
MMFREPASELKLVACGFARRGAQKKTSACAVSDAFENPRFTVGASGPGFGSHYWVGLQAPDH